MFSDSRKAQHNSFAHHRAELLFSNRSTHAGESLWSATIHEGTEPAVRPSARRLLGTLSLRLTAVGPLDGHGPQA